MSITAMQAQVTVGADREPKATLEIVGKTTDKTAPDGVMMPQITGDELKAKEAHTIKPKRAQWCM